MDHGRAQQLVIRRHATVTVGLWQTWRAVNHLGGNITRTIEGPPVVVIKAPHRFKRLAALELPKDPRESWV
jgi:hypothetical protein